MSFTDGKPFTVTEEQTKLRWGGGFWCKLCGHAFIAGDTARWIYANSTPKACVGNFMVCADCDEEDNAKLIETAKASLALATRLAKQWGIYGPDWERDYQRNERMQ